MYIPKWIIIVALALVAWFVYDGYTQTQAARAKTGGVGPL